MRLRYTGAQAVEVAGNGGRRIVRPGDVVDLDAGVSADLVRRPDWHAETLAADAGEPAAPQRQTRRRKGARQGV